MIIHMRVYVGGYIRVTQTNESNRTVLIRNVLLLSEMD